MYQESSISGVDLLIIITAILNLIMIICFFVLVANVSKIKKALYRDEDYYDLLEKADEEEFIGNIMEYRELLLRAKWKIQKRLKFLASDVPVINNDRAYLEEKIAEIDAKLNNIKN